MTYVADHEIHAIVIPTETRVERARPDLCVCVESINDTADIELKGLEIGELGIWQLEHAGAIVSHRTCSFFVGIEGVSDPAKVNKVPNAVRCGIEPTGC